MEMRQHLELCARLLSFSAYVAATTSGRSSIDRIFSVVNEFWSLVAHIRMISNDCIVWVVKTALVTGYRREIPDMAGLCRHKRDILIAIFLLNW